MANNSVINVFQPGLKRGSEVSAWAKKQGYGPNKKYFYVEHPIQKWRVFMRACCFIHMKGERDPNKFIVVKSTGESASGKTWEPPKGQTEGKDGLKDPSKPLLKVLEENLRREIYEEAKIENVINMKHTGLVLQSQEDDYPDNTYFQYHIFQAFITQEEYESAQEKFKWYKAHPKAWNKLRKDNREKDEIGWFNPSSTKLYGRWSPSIVAMYLNTF
jgi:8-oxo-dGTP pyrophosphatase MutT (NUDIX family)